jgi:glutamyl-tRNA synthetase
MKNNKVITRFAPSPTGFMHVGGVRTALYAWLFAKQNNGKFILRIEDTDKEREVSGAIEHIKNSLNWLGLSYDEFYIQSERLSIYKKYAEKLVQKGLAYADPYSEEELESFRKKAEEEKRPFLFRDYRPENPPVWDGSKPLRFKVEKIKRYAWNDLVWGELSAGEEALDDFILIKSDGYPTYNFAHIVDDIEMEVSHVMRGQEFISSTPKFLSLYDALEVPPPYFATLPPILGVEGTKKLSKRDGAKDILDYEKEGYLPDAMINFLAFLGWNPGDEREVMTRNELIDAFEVEKIQRSGARLNDDKLDWLNKEHLKLLSKEVIAKEIESHLKNVPEISESSKLKDKTFLEKLYPIIAEHISKFGDVETMAGAGDLDYYFNDPKYDSGLLSWKGKSPVSEAKEHLKWVHQKLSESPDNAFESVESIKSLIFDYATEKGRGEVLWPLRISLCGKEKSPDPFTLIYVLGKEESLKRIENAIKN